mmetsp:Transcript_949/g.2041  ORF Transcript_949/g.2041 Transcript_949/m.2041 type:complete len:1224 (-) Transcript_949:127-3798(-)
MIEIGIPTGNTGVGSGGVGGTGKFVLFAGDDTERQMDVDLDPRNSQAEKRPITVYGYEYGLANMAAFLSQVMVDGIYDDACDELSEQRLLDRSGNPTNVYPFSNACGQWNASYEDMTCPLPEEKGMECPLSPGMTIVGSNVTGKENRGLYCGPTSVYSTKGNQKNDYGRTDVEGCCWWGRGPLHTKGLCSMGKVNYYMGAKAFQDRRITLTTPGVFPDIDFCDTPDAVCPIKEGKDTLEDRMWSVAMFEWAERVQRYRYSSEDESSSSSWNYEEKLVEFVNGGMNMFEYYTKDVDTDRDNSFIHAVSSIVDRGCHNAPHCFQFGGPVDKLPLRRTAFTIALSALNIPTMRKELVVEQTLDHLESKRDNIQTNLLLYKTKSGIYQSQRYKIDDFLDALYRFSRPYDASDISYSADTTYFYSSDHPPLYMGDPYMKHGQKYGLSNIALFLSNGLELSIEEDETCDELNEHQVSGKLPISNACGQRGLSYQNMVCVDDPDMACPVDTNMYITAVTARREFGAAPALQCGPKYRIPSTGYWDFSMVQESELEAYANDNARVDVEGCCWWGRGVLQTKGTCSFGRLNYYLGKRAADEGRESLFSEIDFCSNPEAVCGSASTTKHELLWMSGLFHWIDQVQSYDKGGFNYMNELHAFADGGMRDAVFIKRVRAIVQVGCHEPPCESAGCLNFPCEGASVEDENAGVRKAYRTFFELNLWDSFPDSPGGSNTPTPVPTLSPSCITNCTEFPSSSPLQPTASPSKAPFTPPTSVPSEPPTRVVDSRISYFEDLSTYLKLRRTLIESEIFVSKSKNRDDRLYTLDGFLNALRDFATEGVGDLLFYIGRGKDGNFDHGLTNIALFFAHAMTRGIAWNTCEEVNHHLIDGKLPLSNACGQHGRSYSNDICPQTDAAMECAVNPNLEVTQVSVGDSGSPEFFCAPTSTNPFTGYYDPVSGNTGSSTPISNQAGRTDVEGCCFWGRGILLNQGVCDIGRFNYAYGLPAFVDQRSSARYNIDFCAHPEALCSDFTIAATEFNQFSTTIDTSEVRYLIGLVYWADYVQEYNWGYFDYMEELKIFVDSGMKDDSFVDQFSKIVVDSSRDADERKANFKRILEIFMTDAPTQNPTLSPTRSPSMGPTVRPTYEPYSVERPPEPQGDDSSEPGPGEEDTAVNPNKPQSDKVTFDLSVNRPNQPPSKTVVDRSSATHISSSGMVWALFFSSLGILVFSCSYQ